MKHEPARRDRAAPSPSEPNAATGPRILLVEDDRTLRDTLAEALEQEGLRVARAADGSLGTRLVFERHFDLVILDVMLPGRGGFEILREIRDQGLTVPVLMLTVRGDECDKVLGFDLGADDYVTKPFSLRELLARVRALLRRGRTTDGRATNGRDADGRLGGPHASAADTGDSNFRIGAAEIDLAAYRVSLDGRSEPLSPREAAILLLLRREAGRVVTRDRFLDEVWGRDVYVGHRTIDTHMLNLRQKIERDPKSPAHLLTVRGVGYRLVLEPDEPRPEPESDSPDAEAGGPRP